MDKTKKIAVASGVLIVTILFLGYLGFVPWLSDLMGVNKGSLGVKYTDNDLNSGSSKLGIQLTPKSGDVLPEDSIVIKGSKEVDTNLNSAELTALVNELTDKWKYFPLSATEVRINADGSVEVQGKFLADRFNGFAQAVSMDESAINQVALYTSLIKTEPLFYIKFTLSVTEYNVNANLREMKVGNINVPSSELGGFQSTFSNYMEGVLENPPIVKMRTLTFGDDAVHLVGTLPTEISVAPP